MFDRVLSSVIDVLLAVPPIRVVMDLVDSRWGPLWAALWIGVIIYLLSRAMNQLALARARMRIVSEPMGGLALAVQHPRGDSPRPDGSDATGSGRSAPRETAGSPTAAEKPATRESGGIPVHIVIAALVVGAIAVVNVALFMRRPPNDSSAAPGASSTQAADSTAQQTPIDMRMRSSRMDSSGNCIGTFEVTHGPGTTARLLAFAMDSSGGIIARDSTTITSAVTGMFVELQFRQVNCAAINDWQIQATTPTRSQ